MATATQPAKSSHRHGPHGPHLRRRAGVQTQMFRQDELGAPRPISKWTNKPYEPDEYGRDPNSPTEQLRELNTWKQPNAKKWKGKPKEDFTGPFGALPKSFFADLGRIRRSGAQVLMLLYAWSETYSGQRKKGSNTPPLFCEEMTYEEWADIMQCHVRQVYENITDAEHRVGPGGKEDPAPLIEVKRSKGGKVAIRCLPENWRRATHNTDLPQEVAAKDRPAAERHGLLSQPWQFRARCASPSAPLPEDAKEWRIKDITPEGTDYKVQVDAALVGQVLEATVQISDVRLLQANELRENLRGIPQNGRENGRRHHGAGPPAEAASPPEKPQVSENHAKQTNGLRENPGGIPQKPDAPINRLKDSLIQLGYGISGAYARKLFALIPEGCPVDFAVQTVRERRDRPGAKPLTDPMLLNWFREDLPTRWEFHKQRSAELAVTVDWRNDKNYREQFVAPYLESGAAPGGKTLIDQDFEDAYRVWQALKLPDRIERLRSLALWRPVFHRDPVYAFKPRKFLEKDWESKPVAKKNGKLTREQRVELLDRLEELDARANRR